MQNINKKNGEKLKGFRKQNGYTRAYVGTLVGRCGRSIGYYESGQKAMPDTLIDFLNGQYNLKLQKSKKSVSKKSKKQSGMSSEKTLLLCVYDALNELVQNLKVMLNV